jgi:hypothetical protein
MDAVSTLVVALLALLLLDLLALRFGVCSRDGKPEVWW